MYLLDEPSTGLHLLDVQNLHLLLNKLVDAGNTVIMVEHNTDLIAAADWVIDMGPGGGTSGGRLVASGTPDDVASVKESFTGKNSISKMIHIIRNDQVAREALGT
ncbi:hypothetical protein ABES80_20305 [Bacillus gobiensis]|uniref:hypothetical protein n=1 Tax=Bacillus gobiensis TaxID=1441095 RepID=UPI003D226B27